MSGGRAVTCAGARDQWAARRGCRGWHARSSLLRDLPPCSRPAAPHHLAATLASRGVLAIAISIGVKKNKPRHAGCWPDELPQGTDSPKACVAWRCCGLEHSEAD